MDPRRKQSQISVNYEEDVLETLRTKRKSPVTEIKSSIDSIHRLIEQQQYQTIIGRQWQILGRVLDRLLVYLFFFGTIFVFYLILSQAPQLRLK